MRQFDKLKIILRTGGGRDVTLTLPDGRRVTFAFTLVPAAFGYSAYWNAPPGVHATLVPTVNNQLTILAGMFSDGDQVYYVPPYWTATGAGTSWENYDFPSFILTTQDGTQYVITRDSLGEHTFLSGYADDYYIQAAYGLPHLSKIILPSGEKIVINTGNSGPSGGQFSVDYLNAAGPTNRSIYFLRNTDGQISAIMDPISGADGLPVVKYEYDNNQNLMNVLKLVDRSTGSYTTNTFLYENSAFPHYITSIIDPRGVQVARQLFDDTGKLIGIIDANGHTNRFVHDLANRTETVFDRMGNQTIYGYDSRGNVTTEIDALNHTAVQIRI